MLEYIADFTTWPILTGILVGYIANRIMSGEGKGCCMNLIMGIIGSYVGTQPPAKHRTIGERLSHQFCVLCSRSDYGIVDLEKAF